MKNYSGNPIDLSWQTAPWNRDGETIKKETENQEGEITMTELPAEVDQDELTDLQEKIIRTAVRNPELSTSQIDEVVECGKHYSSNVLAEKVPDWYENAFKKMGKSVDRTRDDYRDKETDVSSKSSAEHLAEETGRDKEEFEPPEDIEYPEPEDLETVGESDTSHAHDYRSNTPETPEWKAYAIVALLSFILGLLWGGRNE
jgi:hypothetical protein